MRTIGCGAAILTALFTAAAFPADGPATAKSGGLSFEVNLPPGKPDVKRETLDDGTIVTTMSVSKNDVTFGAQILAYPDAAAETIDQSRERLRKFSEDLVKQFDGKAVLDDAFTTDEQYPGRFLSIEAKSKETNQEIAYVGKLQFVDGRLYQVYVQGDPKTCYGPTGFNFLKSFKVKSVAKASDVKPDAQSAVEKPAVAKPAVEKPAVETPAASEMRPFKSPDGKFQVRMPGEVVSETNTPLDGPSTTTHVVRLDDREYCVTVTEPVGRADEPIEQKEQRLVAARANLCKNFGGALLEDTSFTTPYPGRDLWIAMDLKGPDTNRGYRGRLLIVGNRFYQVFVVGTPAACDSLEASEFLWSFSVLGDTAPAAVAKPTPNNTAGDVTPFQSPGGRWEVLFPSPPAEHVRKDFTYYVTLYDDVGYFVMIQYFELNADESYEQLQEEYDNTLNKAREDMSGRIIENVPIRLENRYDGRMVRMKVPTPERGDLPTLYRGRYFCVGDYYYQIYAIGSPEKIDSETVTKFLKSFYAVR